MRRGGLAKAFLAAAVALAVLGADPGLLAGPPPLPVAPEALRGASVEVHAASATAPLVPHPLRSASNVSWGPVCTGSVPCAPGNPNAFTGSVAAYDVADGYSILFGGSTQSYGYYSLLLNETFEFVPGTPHWTTLNLNGASGAPKPRRDPAIAYDYRDGYVLMFGGTSTTAGTERGDAWTFHAGHWTQLGAPPAAMKATMAGSLAGLPGPSGYDLYFGGCAGSTLAYYANTWEYVAGTWTNISASAGTAPPASCGGNLVYDSSDGYFVYFGGFTKTGPQNGTWEFNPSTLTWSQLYAPAANGQPNPRGYAQMQCVAAALACYLYGGASGTPTGAINRTGDLWKFANGTWTNVTAVFPGNGPTVGWWNAATWNTSVAFYFEGGTTKTGLSNQTWAIGTIITGVSLQSNFGEVLNGSALTLYANVSGGVGPFTYTYTGLPGCTSSNTTVLRCVTSVPGYYPGLSVTVYDGGTGLTSAANAVDFPLTVDPAATAYASLSVNGLVRTQHGGFWGINTQGGFANAGNGSALNLSVFQQIRWGEGAGTNITSCQSYSANGQLSSCGENISQFVSWCKANHCSVELPVPIEQNNMGAISYEVEYIERDLGFTPTSWGLGNEPEGWTEYGIPPASWRSTNDYTISASGFATLAKSAITAIRSVDGSTPIIGIEASSCGDTYETHLMAVDGPNVSAISCHSYPGGGKSQTDPAHNLAQFLSLTSTEGAIARLGAFEANLKSQDQVAASNCPTGYSCAGVQKRVDEFNSVLGTNALTQSSAEVPAVASELYYALLDPNTSGADFFDFAGSGFGLFNVVPSQPTPAWSLFSTVLKNLTQGDVYNVTFTGPERNLLGLETVNASTSGRSLLLVNDNSTVTFLVDTSSWYPGTQPRTFAINAGSSLATVTSYAAGGFDRLVSLAPEEVLLIDFGNASSSVVTPPVPSPTLPPVSSAAGTTDLVLVGAVIIAVVVVFALIVADSGSSREGVSRRRY